MRKLIELFMNEPAVALGTIAAASVTALKVAGGGALTAEDLITILTPLATGAGVRQFVTPVTTGGAKVEAAPGAQTV